MVVQNDISSVNAGQKNLRSDVSVAQTSIASVNRQLSTAQGNIVKNKISQQISNLINTKLTLNQLVALLIKVFKA